MVAFFSIATRKALPFDTAPCCQHMNLAHDAESFLWFHVPFKRIYVKIGADARAEAFTGSDFHEDIMLPESSRIKVGLL